MGYFILNIYIFLVIALQAIFCKQVSRSSCGIVSCAQILSAGYLGNNRGLHSNKDPLPTIETSTLPYTEDKMYSYPATTSVVSQDKV